MEEITNVSGATDEWEAFVASIDPDELERERFGVPTWRERPGSAGWRDMLREHEIQVAHYKTLRARPPRITEEMRALVLAEMREWDSRFTRHLTEKHLEIAIRAAERAA